MYSHQVFDYVGSGILPEALQSSPSTITDPGVHHKNTSGKQSVASDETGERNPLLAADRNKGGEHRSEGVVPGAITSLSSKEEVYAPLWHHPFHQPKGMPQ
jgi:hypothetical protein